MNESEVRKLVEKRLRERKFGIVARNTIDAVFKLFPPASTIWQILVGAKDKVDTAKGVITQEVILNMVLAIDKKLSSSILETREQEAFEIMLEGIRAMGDVAGLAASFEELNLDYYLLEDFKSVMFDYVDSESGEEAAEIFEDAF